MRRFIPPFHDPTNFVSAFPERLLDIWMGHDGPTARGKRRSILKSDMLSLSEEDTGAVLEGTKVRGNQIPNRAIEASDGFNGLILLPDFENRKRR